MLSSLIGSAQYLEGVRVQLSCVLSSLFGFRIHAKPSVGVREIDVDPWVVRIGLRGDQKLLQSLLEVLFAMKLYAAPQTGNRFDGLARPARRNGRSRSTGWRRRRACDRGARIARRTPAQTAAPAAVADSDPPAKPGVSSKAPAIVSSASVSTGAATASPSKNSDPEARAIQRTDQSGLQNRSSGSDGDWALPMPVTRERLVVNEVSSVSDETPKLERDEKPAPIQAEIPPMPEDHLRVSPDQLRGGPPRKTTQVRRINEIAPLNDFNKDKDIRAYAAERAQEFNVKFGGEQFTPRNFPEVAMNWAQPSSKYYPLYFQDPALERYGHSHGHLVQPVVSMARFSGQLVLMPYQMAIDPPWVLQSPLGWYRPGDVVPKLRYPFPWNTKAAAVEAAAVTGFIYVIP